MLNLAAFAAKFRNVLKLLLLAIVLVTGTPDMTTAESIGLGQLVSAVKQALVLLDESPDSQFTVAESHFEFDSADLTVSVVTTEEASGEVSFAVVTIDAEAEFASTQTIEVKLIPPKPGDQIEQSALETAVQLVELLEATSSELSDALTGDPELRVDNLEVSTRFGVTKDAGGGFKFKFFGFGGNAGVNLTESNAQELKLTFVRVSE